jgi:RimJ/RimL family protein N-acetyltransferase
MVTSVSEASPWIHWFSVVERESGREVGNCGFKGPPDSSGVVEIAYGIDPDFQRQGFATEAAAGLLIYALSQKEVHLVRAHTLVDGVASQRVLSKCGFKLIGEVDDPEDGLVLRWECSKS